MSELRIVVAGAGGRMGRAVVRAIAEADGAAVSGALEAQSGAHLGQDVGTLAGVGPLGVTVTDDPLPLLAQAHAVIDFTIPAASVELAALSAQARIVHVIGTTGLA